MATTPATTPEFDRVAAALTETLAGLKKGPRRGISDYARSRVLHIEDPDDARDLALDIDEDVRLGFDVDRIEDR